MNFKSIYYIFFTLLVLCDCGSVAWSQDGSRMGGDMVVTHSVYEFQILFPLDSTHLNPRYMTNPAQLKRIGDFVKNAARPGDSLVIWSYASPEGTYKNNVRLSKGRGVTARNYLSGLFEDSGLAEQMIVINPTAENWAGLRELVVGEYPLPDKSQVLQVLDANIPPDTKKYRLKRLNGGKSWDYILKNFMPRLRYAKWVVMLQDTLRKDVERMPALDLPAAQDMSGAWSGVVKERLPVEISPVRIAARKSVEYKKTLFALKTNLVYDLATVLNFAVEVPFGERFSVLYEHHCPWWLSSNNMYCLQFLSFGGEVRWWFRPQTLREKGAEIQRDALVGHFFGLYGWGGKLDFQSRRKLCYQAEFNSLGLTYGYSMPVSRRANVEFSVSVGYAEIPYRHYNPTEGYEILIRDRSKMGTLKYFGPVKAEVSLVIPVLGKSKNGGIYERSY